MLCVRSLSCGRWLVLLAVSCASVLAESRHAAAQAKDSKKPEPTRLSYHDDTADGKKSLGGDGELLSFELPEGSGNAGKVIGIRIHGSRYGRPQAPK